MAVPAAGETDDGVLDRLWRLAAQAIEHADQVLHDGERTAGAAEEPHQSATSARERAALAKRRELAAHLRAIKLHEQAAELQERLGYSDRAARARVHAEHARELHARARQEQREHEGVDAGRWVVG
jgi:type IV secretory pathway VirJ component